MSWTKRNVITQALSEIGLASYAFDATPDELQDAMRMLDSMMAVWTSKSVVFDPVYPQPATVGAGDLDDVTNAPDVANEAMYLNLAVRIAPSFGKQVMQATNAAAVASFRNLLGGYVKQVEVPMTGMIRGAGSKLPTNPFIEG